MIFEDLIIDKLHFKLACVIYPIFEWDQGSDFIYENKLV